MSEFVERTRCKTRGISRDWTCADRDGPPGATVSAWRSGARKKSAGEAWFTPLEIRKALLYSLKSIFSFSFLREYRTLSMISNGGAGDA
jgi:hypothetical protein